MFNNFVKFLFPSLFIRLLDLWDSNLLFDNAAKFCRRYLPQRLSYKIAMIITLIKPVKMFMMMQLIVRWPFWATFAGFHLFNFIYLSFKNSFKYLLLAIFLLNLKIDSSYITGSNNGFHLTLNHWHIWKIVRLGSIRFILVAAAAIRSLRKHLFN